VGSGRSVWLTGFAGEVEEGQSAKELSEERSKGAGEIGAKEGVKVMRA